MKLKNFYYILFMLGISLQAQNKNTTHLLLETGYENTDGKDFINFGIGIERYVSEQFSVIARVKYGHANSSTEGLVKYESSIINVPITLKFENSFFFKNTFFHLHTGPSLNFTLKENYEILNDIEIRENHTYLNINAGGGISYSINNKSSIYLSGEVFGIAGAKTEMVGFIFEHGHSPVIYQLNIGYKFKL
ncbi:hypothetical protein SAMN04489761_3730 [Tenacibaculum sp. MAR_2009_124]|uniref:hypothetical protein n=1 Tax=Tenacibaculum sp. MAR_2009_124 TaxID=1250059 RepID=UPI000897E038|nr:hypothetical protein [Tenacibaculum sp. MAR_2009_124]SEC83816.1 hypothetical protein SAMN04489761_3730 [Tenacibaculum sp. MAR_2009_124]